MFQNNADFQSFYHNRNGWLIRKIIRANIQTVLGDTKIENALGLGYAVPYLDFLDDQKTQYTAAMPSSIAGHKWPKFGENKVAVVSGTELPYATNSMDLVIAIHYLEFSEYPEYALKDIWRILKSNGMLVLIVPNRMSMWARREWTPFGHGQPFSSIQLNHILKNALFMPEEEKNALFFPPWKNRFILKSAWSIERFGQIICPGLGGVRILKASKQIYAPTNIKGSAVPVSPFGLKPKSLGTNSLTKK